MRLIHTSDLHLGAKMDSVYPPELAKARRSEQKEHLSRLFAFARENGVTGILIAGDLFDSERPREDVKNAFLRELALYPEIAVYYLAGNHDASVFLAPPPNLYLFTDTLSGYDLGEGVALYGCENMTEDQYARLYLEEGRTNLLLLHGAVTESGYGRDIVNLRALRRHAIDYLALGHYHEADLQPLDDRGRYAYSGTPFGRGFDECGEKGFFLLDIENGRVDAQFVSLAPRTLHELSFAESQTEDPRALLSEMEARTQEIPARDIVRFLLSKTSPVTPEMAKTYFAPRFFYFETKTVAQSARQGAAAYRDALSLRGEFVRQVEASSFSDEEKNDILLYGLAALAGEEVDL